MNLPEGGISCFLPNRMALKNIKDQFPTSSNFVFQSCCAGIRRSQYNVAFSSNNNKAEIEQYIKILEELFERQFVLAKGYDIKHVNKNFKFNYVVSTKITDGGNVPLVIHTLVRALWTNNKFVSDLIKYWKAGEDNLPLIWFLSCKYDSSWRYGSPCYILSTPITKEEFKKRFLSRTTIYRRFCNPWTTTKVALKARQEVSAKLGIPLFIH